MAAEFLKSGKLDANLARSIALYKSKRDLLLSLLEEHMKKIVGLMCNELAERVRVQLNIKLAIRDSVKKMIVEKGADKKYGARPLRRALQTELEDKLAEAILAGEVKQGSNIDVGVSKKEIVFVTKE